MKPTEKKWPQTKQAGQQPARPTTPAQRFETHVAQSKRAASTPEVRRPAAPPIYQPQPKAAQAKTAGPSQLKAPPAAPPAYRPQPAPRVLQAKTAAPPRPQTRPSALPTRSPQPAPGIVQPKNALAQPRAFERRPGRSAPETPGPVAAFGRTVIPPRAEQAGVNPPQIRPHVPTPSASPSRNTVQRAAGGVGMGAGGGGGGGGEPPDWVKFNKAKAIAFKNKKQAAKQKPEEDKKDEVKAVGGGGGGVARLTATDAAELAPAITTTDDDGDKIGPFNGEKVKLGKAPGFTDAKGNYAISPDLDCHAGAFTWKLFKWSGKSRQYERIDTLNADGSRQGRG